MSAAIFSLMCWALPTSFGEALFKAPGPMDDSMLHQDSDSARGDSRPDGIADEPASDSSSSSSDSSGVTTLVLGGGRARSRSRSRDRD